MASRIPQSSKTVFKLIREIIRMGLVDIPKEFQGTGAPGDTLEYLLDQTRNNSDSPDLMDWEVKFHGGNALLTLFHKDPQPKGIVDKLVNTFGWENEKNQISFRHTIRGKSERGFIVYNSENKIFVSNAHNNSIVPFWDHNIILNAMGAKLRRLILVHGIVDKEKNQVIYKTANAYWDLNLTGICAAIEEGTICIDFDARTTSVRGTSIRNHGTKFRIKINDIGTIYENSEIISS